MSDAFAGTSLLYSEFALGQAVASCTAVAAVADVDAVADVADG